MTELWTEFMCVCICVCVCVCVCERERERERESRGQCCVLVIMNLGGFIEDWKFLDYMSNC